MLATLVTGIALACLLTAAAALHAAAGFWGAVLIGGFLLAGLLLALAWGLIQRRTPTGKARPEAPVQPPSASRDLPAFAAGLQSDAALEPHRPWITEQQADAAELMESALALCQDEAEASDRIIVARLVEGAEIRVDAGRMRQAIAGLVQWALTANGSGGILDVTVRKLADGGLAVDIGSRTDTAGPAGESRLTGAWSEACLAVAIAKRVALLHAGDLAASRASARLTLPASRVTWPTAAGNHNARAA